MARSEVGGRWPAIYGEEELSGYIQDLSRREFLEKSFYEWKVSANLHPPEDLCQGDVVRIRADVPLLDADGEASAEEHESTFWMVLGNSCDFERRLDDVKYTQVVPIERRTLALKPSELATLQGYTQYRRFYLPDWRLGVSPEVFVAELTMPVTLHKAAFPGHVHVEARLSMAAWTLLNACLVRFIARSDGRND